jgi:hypothetical protein
MSDGLAFFAVSDMKTCSLKTKNEKVKKKRRAEKIVMIKSLLPFSVIIFMECFRLQ